MAKQNSDDLYNHLFRVAMADGSLKLDSVCDPNVTGVEKSGAIQITEAVVFPGSHMFILMFEVFHVRLFFSEAIFFHERLAKHFSVISTRA